MRTVLILTGDGINSENELARAFSEQGAKVSKVHINTFLKNPKMLQDHGVLAIPGGFSFGDELKSGKILAEKLRDTLIEGLSTFVSHGGRIIGICNGFQVLAQLGAFDKNFATRSFTLAENAHGSFMDKWTTLKVDPAASTKSCWFKNIEGRIFLPVRHKEGRILLASNFSLPYGPLSYTDDINGSHQNLAGILDSTGQIFGLMPHPEVATKDFLYPFRDGVAQNVNKIQTIFKNGITL
jgi:phosphoribosylformylglycinamidine (FGAM) synthase-like amidotransferase family enzyme